MSQQRAHPRYAIELDAEIQPVGSALPVGGRTRDISRGGFCMLTKAEALAIPSGTRCSIRLALVFSETEFSEQLSLEGTVMWFTRLKQNAQVGIKFDPLTPQMSGYLDMFIRFLEGEEGEADDAEDDIEDDT